jgi:hypothetical protein
MNTKNIRSNEVKPGMHMHVWFGLQQVMRIEPYHGPYDFVIGIAMLTSRSGRLIGMSLCRDDWHEIEVPDQAGA